MKTSEIFDGLLENLKLGGTATTVAARRDEIAKALNKDFYDKTGSTEHKLMVGSFGRYTAIRGVSDLDMIYILPPGIREDYDDETGPRRILNRVRDDLNARYRDTDIRIDQCVVRVQFTSNAFKFEVQPAFENDDGGFDYPDTKAEEWKVTKPRDEIAATKECNGRTSNNMRYLARMARAWKDRNGVVIGGLLIDTLVHRFFLTTSEYDDKGPLWFDLMARDFFQFLAEEPDQERYLALGSKQWVTVKARFQPKAKKAYARCLEAIELDGKASANKKWREIFGTAVPLTDTKADRTFDDTEEFVENLYLVNIEHSVAIDCKVTQNGFRTMLLRSMLRDRTPLLAQKGLEFSVVECTVPEPYEVKWKVLNQGEVAERRNKIRGQIVPSSRPSTWFEQTNFRGDHLVECYVVKDGVVVARDRIDVPISGKP